MAQAERQAADAAGVDADRRDAGMQADAQAGSASSATCAQSIRDDYLAMSRRGSTSALTSDSPFVERLVHFWANHFAVSADKLPVIGLAGLLEFEAIRPHVLGRFSRHAARGRAASGDAALSRPGAVDRPEFARPGSSPPMRGGKQRGLNENLAREIMELHTLGVRTGYSQADVTEFARALTGWTVERPRAAARRRGCSAAGDAGEFDFAEALHEPGDRDDHGQALRPAGRGAGARGPARPRREPGDRAAHLDQARPPFRRRRSAAGDGRAADRGLPRERRRPADRLSRDDRSPEAWAAAAAEVPDAVGMVGRRRCARSGQATLDPTGGGGHC